MVLLNLWLSNVSKTSILNAVHERQDVLYVNDGLLLSILLKSTALRIDFNLSKYIIAVENSVKIVRLPDTLSTETVKQCGRIKKSPLLDNQHSLELRFPQALKKMSYEGIPAPTSLYTPLWLPEEGRNKTLPKTNVSQGATHFSIASEPLFYYVEAFPYHVVYCTNKRNNKEDWSHLESYWKDVASYISETTEWKANFGTDFLLPASHPLLSPSKMNPTPVSLLRHASFMKTDFDVSGAPLKDVIVPYYAGEVLTPMDDASIGKLCTRILDDSINRTLLAANNDRDDASVDIKPNILSDGISRRLQGATTSTSDTDNEVFQRQLRDTKLVSSQRKTLLFFAGSDLPSGGLRSQLYQQLTQLMKEAKYSKLSHKIITKEKQRNQYTHRRNSILRYFIPQAEEEEDRNSYNYEDIYFSTDQLSNEEYMRAMENSKYCLILRGDTTSSRRLFTAINVGCIPVIISDWIKLPFEFLIDYSTFTFTFPEIIVHQMGTLVSFLMEGVGEERYVSMRCTMRDVKPLLLYDVPAPVPVPIPVPVHVAVPTKASSASSSSSSSASASTSASASAPVLNSKEADKSVPPVLPVPLTTVSSDKTGAAVVDESRHQPLANSPNKDTERRQSSRQRPTEDKYNRPSSKDGNNRPHDSIGNITLLSNNRDGRAMRRSLLHREQLSDRGLRRLRQDSSTTGKRSLTTDVAAAAAAAAIEGTKTSNPTVSNTVTMGQHGQASSLTYAAITVSVINPITLAIIEAFHAREKYCDKLTKIAAANGVNSDSKDNSDQFYASTVASSRSMCEKIYARLAAAS
jgi:hypothetical protein